MITAAILGGAAPAAGELIRILVNHPDVELTWVHSERLAGQPVSAYHPGLLGDTFMRFTATPDFEDVKVVFLADGDEAQPFRAEDAVPSSVKIIDLAHELDPAYVYGLPELNRKALVRGAQTASVPGAYSHTIALTLLPLAKEGLLNSPVHVAALGPGADTNNAGASSPQLCKSIATEVTAALSALQEGFDAGMHVVAMHAPMNRGIIAMTYTDMPAGKTLTDVQRIFEDFYADHAFTVISNAPVEIAEVTHTNKSALFLDETDDGLLLITAVSDSLLKGAAGTAVHIMNLMFGLHERVGLALKH